MNELNPGQYCGERDRQFSLTATRYFVGGGSTAEHDLRVNARSASHARQLASNAGYQVYAVRKLNF